MKWPQGWREVVLSDVIESAQPGFAQRPGEEDEGTTPQIRTHNVSPDGRITLEGVKHVMVADGDLERYRLLPGDVVFNNTNSEEWVGKTAVFDQHEGVFVYSNHMTRIRVRHDLLLPEFLATYLHFLWSVGYSRNRAKRWVSQAGIDAPTLLKFKLLLPPLPEQQRIVEVLQAADALRQAKQRVLQGFDEVVQAQYRAQFGRYFTRQGLLNATRIGEHVESAQYGVSEAMAEAGTHAVLRMNSITSSGWLDLSDLKYADLSSQDAAATTLQDGDLLFNRTNSRELVGKCAIWRDQPGRYSFASYLVRLRLKPTLLPEYLWATLNSPYGKYRLFNAAKQAVSMANVSPTDLARISIPLPSIEEQTLFAAFVREVERQRGQIIESGTRMQTLQPALITEALSGRLTAAWREQHAQALAEAARERDARLGAPAPQVTVRITEHAPAERRTDLARPRRQAVIEQLSSFQHAVWNTLRVEWRGAVLTDDPAAFEEFCTSPQTAWRQEGFAAGREQVRRALEQLAAMGLIRKMSLPRPDPNTGRTEYLTAFRPLREAEDGSRPEEDTALADAERLARELERRRAPEAR
jgi:type I restriction enzyme S subunit